MTTLLPYLAKITKLKVDARTVAGVRLESPYKPALLLAVLEGMEEAGYSGQPHWDYAGADCGLSRRTASC